MKLRVSNWLIGVARVTATAVLGISVTALTGYMTRMEELRSWNAPGPSMALSTAVCFIALSVGVFALTVFLDEE